eukprot:evm.model.scf_2202.2 EVM.evm.TU.scf_2202.2   scf_2202:17793-23519(-)
MEDFSRNLLASLVGRRPGSEGQAEAASATTNPGSQSQSSDGVREKIASQLANALAVGVRELSEQADSSEVHDPQEVATAVETELYNQYGGVGKEYKQKFRSLHFNLTDAKNPDLRAQVVMGKIAPDVLVRMGPNELASSELNKWRSQKAQEFLKSAVLDGETAAAFSTAAAMKLGRPNGKDSRPATPEWAGPLDVSPEQRTASSRLVGRALGAMDTLPTTSTSAGIPRTKSVGSEGGQDAHDANVPPSPPLTPLHADDGYMKDFAGLPGAEGPAYDPGYSSPGASGLGPSHELPLDGANPEEAALPDWAMAEWEGDRSAASGAAAAGDGGTGSTAVEASRVGAPPSFGATTEYSPTLPQAPPSYSPNRLSDSALDEVPGLQDMAPLVQMPAEPGAAVAVGAHVWQGRFCGPGMMPFKMKCESLAGVADLSKMFFGIEEVEIKGRVGSDKVETFLEQLRGSQSRTVTLGLLKLADDAGLMDQTGVNELIKHYSRRGRVGVVAPGPQLEGYLVAKSDLAARLLMTAREVVEQEQRGSVPDNASPSGELLLVMIHKRSWAPPVNNMQRGGDGSAGAAGRAESEQVPTLANTDAADDTEWMDVSNDPPETSDAGLHQRGPVAVPPFAHSTTAQSRQPTDPRRPQEAPAEAWTHVQPNGGSLPHVSGQMTDQMGMPLNTEEEKMQIDEEQPPQEASLQTKLPQGLNLKGISELAALFGIPPAASGPPSGAPQPPASMPPQDFTGPSRPGFLPQTNPGGVVVQNVAQAAGGFVGPAGMQVASGPLQMGDVVPGQLQSAAGEMAAPPSQDAPAQRLGPAGVQGAPFQSPTMGTGPLGDGMQQLNINGTPGSLGPLQGDLPGVPQGEDGPQVKWQDLGQLAAGWKHAPEGGVSLPMPLTSSEMAPTGFPQAGGGIPQIIQVQGPRPTFVVIQDQLLQKDPVLRTQLPVAPFAAPTHSDSQGRHPGLHGLPGVGAGSVLQPQGPQLGLASQGRPGAGETEHVLVNSKGVPIIVKPKKPGRAPPGRDVDVDGERDPYLPLPGAPPVTPSPPGPLGPMRREAPPGPYQRIADAQTVPAGNVIEPILGRIQRPAASQGRGSGSGRRRGGRGWSSGGGQYRSKRRDAPS